MENTYVAGGILLAATLGMIILFCLWVGAEAEAKRWKKMENRMHDAYDLIRSGYDKMKPRIDAIDRAKTNLLKPEMGVVPDYFVDEYNEIKRQNVVLTQEIDKIRLECAKAMDQAREYMDLYRTSKYEPRQKGRR
jgi:hypothetical protein